MILHPTWRNRLFAIAATILAVGLSVEIAQEEFLWPGLAGAALLLFLLARLQPLSLTGVLLLAVTAGYIIGNRGFAQLTPTTRFPLLPAEAVLLIGGAILLVQCAWRHELPVRRDALNFVLLLWILLGALRIGFDVRHYGAMALRDFALVYYAAFFFFAQHTARDPRFRRLFERVLLIASILLVLIFPLYEKFPDFFFNTLAWRGVPLIFYKGDLIITFIAMGAVLHFLRFELNGRWWHVVAALALSVAVFAYNARAAMLALFVATAWLALGGRWRFAAVQTVAGVIGIAALLMFAAVTKTPWQKTPLFSLYERVVSIADPMGERTYQGTATFSKGDNNLYRAVWWRAVFEETVEENPYLGLGFGRDLAARFVRIYYPESDEFNVRSPHNVLLTIFARMGAVGLVVFLVMIVLIAIKTWRAVRAGPQEAGLWCAVWAMLTSACLGVVLEGPMGAVVFWTTLGLANAPTPQTDAKEPTSATAPLLRPTDARDEVASAS